MQVKIISHSSRPIDAIYMAYRQCYSKGYVGGKLFEKLKNNEIDKSKKIKLIQELISSGHLSPLEHVSFTFAIDGISRACSHQLVRHRFFSFSQQCLTGDIKIKGCVSGPITIKELFDKKMVLVMNETYIKTLLIHSVDNEGNIIQNKLTDVWSTGEKFVYEVKTKSGYTIKSTDNHKFLNEEFKFVDLKTLKVGSKIYVTDKVSSNIQHDTISSIEPIGIEETYDIEMRGPYNNFIANGFIVHNSQRYVNFYKHGFEYHIPARIEKDEILKKNFIELMDKINDEYIFMNKRLKDIYKMDCCEDARSILPNASDTKIVATTNVEELLHFFSVRSCNRAQSEIRRLADLMLIEVNKITPELFCDAGSICERLGYCVESVNRTCGKMPLKADFLVKYK